MHGLNHTTAASVHRHAWVEIDLGAIEKNTSQVISWLKPSTKLMAIVKGDAYGHGACEIARTIKACGAKEFGVASVDEGCQLRAAAVEDPILILSPCPAWAIGTALDNNLALTVTAKSQILDIVAAAIRAKKKAAIHLKVDTGMHRLGISPAQVDEVVSEILSHKEIVLTGVFSHLAKARDEEFTRYQNDIFNQVKAKLQAKNIAVANYHLASSEATKLFADTHHDMVRAGLYLYGLEPRAASQFLVSAMSVRGRINHITYVEPGDGVGYGLTWKAERPSKIASIPVGYADGVDRGLSNKINALLLGKKIPQVGTISMDQMSFDITDVPKADVGDVVTLIGSEAGYYNQKTENSPVLHLADWANSLDTITYELASRLRVRMPRIYTRSG